MCQEPFCFQGFGFAIHSIQDPLHDKWHEAICRDMVRIAVPGVNTAARHPVFLSGYQTLVYVVMHSQAVLVIVNFCVFHAGENAVGKKNINDAAFGICPDTCSGESGMSEGSG